MATLKEGQPGDTEVMGGNNTVLRGSVTEGVGQGSSPSDDVVRSVQGETYVGAAEPEDQSWQDFANCLGIDPDLFFPERGASTKDAKEVCRSCVVREDCLEYALVNGEKFGIWGGMSERERRRIRRQRALARVQPGAGSLATEQATD